MATTGYDKLANVLQSRIKHVSNADGLTVEFGTLDNEGNLTLNSTGSSLVIPEDGYSKASTLRSSGRYLVAWVGNTPVVIDATGGGGGGDYEIDEEAISAIIDSIV